MFCRCEVREELETRDGVDADVDGAVCKLSSSSELGCEARYALLTSELLRGPPNSSVVNWREERNEVGGGRYLRTRSNEGAGVEEGRPSSIVPANDDLCVNGTRSTVHPLGGAESEFAVIMRNVKGDGVTRLLDWWKRKGFSV